MLQVFKSIANPKGFNEFKCCLQDWSSNKSLNGRLRSWVKSNTSATVFEASKNNITNYFIPTLSLIKKS